MDIFAALGMAGVILGSAAAGWFLRRTLEKPLLIRSYERELDKQENLIENLRQEVESNREKIKIEQAKLEATQSALHVCHVRLEVATGGTEAILEAARSMVQTTANLMEKVDPTGGGTEPL